VGKKKNLQEKKELSYIRPLFNSLSFYENRGYISEPSQLHDVAGEPGSGRLRTGLITGGCLIQTVSNNRPVVVKTGIRKILTPGEGRRVRGGGGTKGGKGREREREREEHLGSVCGFVTLALLCLALLSSSPLAQHLFGSKGIYVPLFSSVMSMCCCCPLQTPAAALPPCLPACLPATLVF
jgi:hypothetical protein